ncbi:MAG TPA: hypothetical protein VNM38_09310 [Solirubrobacterales bacterium]|nr:hypothetical protein [Solirubrobacterales bacterium]
MLAKKPTTLTITLNGPLVHEHRLPLSELQRISQHVRGALRDVALVITQRGPSGKAGRVEKFIEQAVDLRVVGQPRAGSFKLEMEIPTDIAPDPQLPADFGPGVADDAVRTLVSGISQISDETEQLPRGFDRGVLKAITRLNVALKKGIESIDLAANGAAEPCVAVLDKGKISTARALIKRPHRAQAVVDGVLQMVDFASLECRVDRPPKPSVRCFFDEAQRGSVFEAVRQYVRVIGEGEFEPDRVDPVKIAASSIEVLYESLPLDRKAFEARHTIASLGKEQGSRTFHLEIDDDDPWRSEDEANALIASIEEESF